MELQHGDKLKRVYVSIDAMDIGFGADGRVAMWRAEKELTVVAMAEHIVCWCDREGVPGTTMRQDLGRIVCESIGDSVQATAVCQAADASLKAAEAVSAAIEKCREKARRWLATADAAHERVVRDV